jgi:hypothetical protein
MFQREREKHLRFNVFILLVKNEKTLTDGCSFEKVKQNISFDHRNIPIFRKKVDLEK